MTSFSAYRHAQHPLFVKGLYRFAAWVEKDVTIPTPEHLPIVIPADSAAVLNDIAIGHDLDGPHVDNSGNVYLYRSFGGGVSYQAVVFNNRDGLGDHERHARAWADAHGFMLVPRIDATTHHTTGGAQ